MKTTRRQYGHDVTRQVRAAIYREERLNTRARLVSSPCKLFREAIHFCECRYYYNLTEHDCCPNCGHKEGK